MLEPGINASLLKKFDRTPLHAKWEMDHPDDDTKSLLVGHASHTAVLEPDRYDGLYAAFPKAVFVEKYGHPNSNKYKAARDAWYAERENACIITDEEDALARGIRKAVESHPLARALLLDGKGRNELTVIGEIEHDGHTLDTKARIDRLATYNGCPAVVDLKTIATRGAALSPRTVCRAVIDYGYHQQLAWYLDRLNDAAPADRLAILVFVENTPPHDVAVYCIEPETLDQGRRDNARALAQLHRGKTEGIWPGYSNDLLSLQLPQWAFDRSIDL